jgi:hypothetical protein
MLGLIAGFLFAFLILSLYYPGLKPDDYDFDSDDKCMIMDITDDYFEYWCYFPDAEKGTPIRTKVFVYTI